MISEACATGAPVYVYDLPGGSAKFNRFHHAIRERGYVRKFAGKLDFEEGKRLDEMPFVAKAITARLPQLLAG